MKNGINIIKINELDHKFIHLWFNLCNFYFYYMNGRPSARYDFNKLAEGNFRTRFIEFIEKWFVICPKSASGPLYTWTIVEMTICIWWTAVFELIEFKFIEQKNWCKEAGRDSKWFCIQRKRYIILPKLWINWNRPLFT